MPERRLGGNILLLDLGQVGDKEYKIKLSLSNIPKLFLRKNSSKNICKTPLLTLGGSFLASLQEFLDCVEEETTLRPDIATISDILEGVL